MTTAKTQAYQSTHGLTADGVVGGRTWARLTA
jgi:peptidoglycan hydrolase-like protein with peptidoglycan-binding domain